MAIYTHIQAFDVIERTVGVKNLDAGLRASLEVSDATLTSHTTAREAAERRDALTAEVKELRAGLEKVRKDLDASQLAPLEAQLAAREEAASAAELEVRAADTRRRQERLVVEGDEMLARVRGLVTLAERSGGVDAVVAVVAALRLLAQLEGELTFSDHKADAEALSVSALEALNAALVDEAAAARSVAEALAPVARTLGDIRSLGLRLREALDGIDRATSPTEDGFEARREQIAELEVEMTALNGELAVAATASQGLGGAEAIEELFFWADDAKVRALDVAAATPLARLKLAVEGQGIGGVEDFVGKLEGLEAFVAERQAAWSVGREKLTEGSWLLAVGEGFVTLGSVAQPLTDESNAQHHDLEALPLLDPKADPVGALGKFVRLVTITAQMETAHAPFNEAMERNKHFTSRKFRKALERLAEKHGHKDLVEASAHVERAEALLSRLKSVRGQAEGQLEGMGGAIDPALEDDDAFEGIAQGLVAGLPVTIVEEIEARIEEEGEGLATKVFGFFKSKESKNTDARKKRLTYLAEAAARRSAKAAPLSSIVATITLPEVLE